jgi:TonB-linked SusC/RagA family outer membrane protein
MLAHSPLRLKRKRLTTWMVIRVSYLLILNSKSMKNSQPLPGRGRQRLLFKFLVIMKLSILLILLGILQTQAGVYAQGSITLNLQQVEIAKVLNKIEKKGEYRFLYNYDLASLKKKVNVHLQNSDIKEALTELFANTDLRFKILVNNLVVVMSSGTERQAIRITGIVTGAAGEPLAGVSVQVKGTNNGTATGNKGEYSLTVDGAAILRFSYIGYLDKEMPVNGENIVNVQMSPSDKALDQLVVVGYGSQRKKDLTGAVSVVTAADIANRPIVDAGEALQGKAAGVQVVSNSGKPGAGLTIRIRGSSSISAGNDPLYIIDGIPTTDISAFNPNDIETISILKDAASASIYGTRAANGVVVITTKKGVPGKSKVNFSTYYGTTSATRKLSSLNGKQYQAYANEQKQATVITDSMVNANNINWPDEIFQNGSQQNYQLSVAGGSEKSQHYISLNYTDQKGIVKPARYNRITGRVNITTKATDWLSVISSTVVSRSNDNDVTDNASVAKQGIVLSALETPPTVPRFNADGTIGVNPLTGWDNPLSAVLGYYAKSQNDRLLSNIGADVKLFKGLVFQSRFGIDYQNSEITSSLDPFLTVNGRNTQGQQKQTKYSLFTWLSEQTLNYTTTIGKNHLSALAGWTAQDAHTDQTSISGSFLNPIYRFLPWDQMYLRDSIKQPGSKYIDDWALISYLGRITYDFDGKYLFQANLRSDNSSKFAPGNRTAVFPSFSAGWRISQEDFMSAIPVINDLKLRAGWGQNGNQEGIGSFAYLPLSTIDPITGATTAATIAPQSLTWETSTQTNIGIDAAFFNSRLLFSGDFYVKKTKNVLYNVQLPSQAGFSTAPVNGANMQNIGEEFLLSSKNVVKGDLRWSTDFTISFNRNKITALVDGITFVNGYGNVYARGNAVALTQGYGLGEFYGYVAKGVDPATGHELYQTKADTLSDNPAASDRILLGSAQPSFVYGMTNNLSYKNFDLTVFIQGSQGGKLFNAGRLEAEAMVNAANQSSAVLARWEKKGDITDIPGVSTDATTNNSLISSRFLESGSYLRFKTITLAYRFSPKIIDRLGLGAASIYISGNNLITITKYKGFDPEVNSNGNPIRVNPDGTQSNDNESRNIGLGLDSGAYPQSKMVLVGLNITLK